MRRVALVFAALLFPLVADAEILHRPDPDVEAGIAALEAGDAEGALERFERAARRRPREGRIHLNRGLALRELGRMDEAREAFGQALAAGGASREALHGLGHLHAAQGELEEAIASFRSALERDPEDAAARKNIEALLRLRQQEQQEQQEQEQEGDGVSEGEEDSEDGSEEGEEDAEGGEGSSPEEQDAEEGESSEGEDSSGGQEEGEGESEGSEQGEEAAGSEQGPGSAPDEEGEGEEEGASAQEAPAGPTETERILDALKAREKSLQLFRTQDRKGRRTDAEKDW